MQTLDKWGLYQEQTISHLIAENASGELDRKLQCGMLKLYYDQQKPCFYFLTLLINV